MEGREEGRKGGGGREERRIKEKEEERKFHQNAHQFFQLLYSNHYLPSFLLTSFSLHFCSTLSSSSSSSSYYASSSSSSTSSSSFSSCSFFSPSLTPHLQTRSTHFYLSDTMVLTWQQNFSKSLTAQYIAGKEERRTEEQRTNYMYLQPNLYLCRGYIRILSL